MPIGGPFGNWRTMPDPPKVGKPHRDRKKAKRKRSGR